MAHDLATRTGSSRAATVALACVAAIALAPSVALAEGLVVHTREFGSWTESIAALQRDRASEGLTIHVGVMDDGARPLECSGYRLTPDAAAVRAFTLGRCDPATRLTELRLVRRMALFARAPDGSIRVRGAGITAAVVPVGPASTVAMLPAISLDAVGPIIESRVATTCNEAPEIDQGVVVDGTTLDGSQRPIYQLHLDGQTSLRLDVTSTFGGEIDIFAGCPDGLLEIRHSSVFGVGPQQRLSWDLAPGDYYVVIIDADIHPHRGHFFMRTELQHDYLASIR